MLTPVERLEIREKILEAKTHGSKMESIEALAGICGTLLDELISQESQIDDLWDAVQMLRTM